MHSFFRHNIWGNYLVFYLILKVLIKYIWDYIMYITRICSNAQQFQNFTTNLKREKIWQQNRVYSNSSQEKVLHLGLVIHSFPSSPLKADIDNFFSKLFLVNILIILYRKRIVRNKCVSESEEQRCEKVERTIASKKIIEYYP